MDKRNGMFTRMLSVIMSILKTINIISLLIVLFILISCNEKSNYKISKLDCWLQETYGYKGDTLIVDSVGRNGYKLDSSSIILLRLKIETDHFNAYMDREDSLIRINFIDIHGENISNNFYPDSRFTVLQKQGLIMDEYINVIPLDTWGYESYPLLNIPSTDSLIRSYNSSVHLMLEPALMISNFIVYKASNESIINSLNKIEVYTYNYANQKISKIESFIKKKNL